MPTCPICIGCRWVCSVHTSRPWGTLVETGCQCGAEGAACTCNPDALMPPGTEVIASAEAGKDRVQ